MHNVLMEVTNKYKINITIENTVQNYYTTHMTTEKKSQ